MPVDTLPPLEDLRVLRRAQVLAATGLSDSRLRQLEAAGKFPKRIALGDNAVAWRERAVREWLQAREKATHRPQGNSAALTPTPQPAAPARPVKALRSGNAKGGVR